MSVCNLCPRRCMIDRRETLDGTGALGVCGMGRAPVAARAGLHHWEEPCISGERGSGAVFFSGCALRCVYCQNHSISTGGVGREITTGHLRGIYEGLIGQGAHNINLVTGSHFAPAIAKSLEPPLPVPVVWNCGGYESPEILALLEGKVQIYLPDMKYSEEAAAARYSNAPGYFEIAAASILEMYRQVGDYRTGEDGTLQSGVVIRHMVLPGNLDNTFGVIDWVAEHFGPGSVLFSLMCQYVPCGAAGRYPEINRALTPEEYERAKSYLLYSGVEDGFLQEQEAASEEFIPDFDFTGLDMA